MLLCCAGQCPILDIMQACPAAYAVCFSVESASMLEPRQVLAPGSPRAWWRLVSGGVGLKGRPASQAAFPNAVSA